MPSPKLTDEEVRRIREMPKCFTKAEIARKMNVSRKTIGAIVNRKARRKDAVQK